MGANDELVAELRGLRAEVRRQRVLVAALLGCAALGLGLGASSSITTLRAHRYELLGPDGVAAMTLEVGPSGQVVVSPPSGSPKVPVAPVPKAPTPAPALVAPTPAPPAPERPTVVENPDGRDPSGRPTLVEPGLAGARELARFEVRGRASSVEVICEAVGFRERAEVVEGVATLALPDAACRAMVHSVAPYPWVDVRRGDWLVCEESPRLTCRRAR